MTKLQSAFKRKRKIKTWLDQTILKTRWKKVLPQGLFSSFRSFQLFHMIFISSHGIVDVQKKILSTLRNSGVFYKSLEKTAEHFKVLYKAPSAEEDHVIWSKAATK